MKVLRFDLPTPHGPLRCAATARGLALITLPGGDFDAQFDERFGPDVAARDAPRHPARRELERYVGGKLRTFGTPIDLSGFSPFRTRVLEALYAVPFAHLVTYGELAAAAGSPGGARAVGGAVGNNPLPIVVP